MRFSWDSRTAPLLLLLANSMAHMNLFRELWTGSFLLTSSPPMSQLNSPVWTEPQYHSKLTLERKFY
ncbi:hypothetical protein BC629DRAFT_1528046 [Irpex lacteus]|nr:hypothetical protein BC629DRAFT_1528046 [Irpex lacteus]